MNAPQVVELERSIRFCLRSDGTLDSDAPKDNTHAAWPPMVGLGRYYEMHVLCVGPIDPCTGYFLNIKQIDQAVRDEALLLISAAAQRSEQALGPVLASAFNAVVKQLGPVVQRIRLALTPYFIVGLEQSNMNQLLISHRYEFAAAHRLHADSLSEEENVQVFGKCNNPSGHGHNYKVEVTVVVDVDSPVGAGTLDAIVDRVVIERFDHKHLNIDTAEFAEMNPSVEHIARVCFELLADEVISVGQLVEVKVWETDKTVCAYRGS